MKIHSQYQNLLLFDSFERENNIVHFSTTRVGGVSNGTFSSFNMGNFSDDNPVNIYENRNILARMFYMDMNKFIVPHQTHGNKVLKVDDDFLQLDNRSLIETMYGIDSTITNKKGYFLCATTADCLPIILYDKKVEAIAAIHAGWKGTLGRIIENTISEMQKHYNCTPNDMIVGIGPSICFENYEVGDELVEYFNSSGFDISDPKVCKRKSRSSKYHLNLKEINRRELVRLGVPEQNIEVSELCTFEKQEMFFSARRQTTHSGRMLTGIMIKED